MSTEPNPDYPNPERLARFMRAFDYTMGAKYEAYLRVEELRKAAQQQIEAMADHSKLRKPYQHPRRRLTPLYAYRYIRDAIRLRRYNESLRGMVKE